MEGRGRLLAPAAAMLLGSVFAATSALANEDVVAVQNLPDHIVMPGISYDGWNYSLLDQVNLANVGALSLAWTLPLGATDEFEAPPLVVGTVMYVVQPQDALELGPNEVLALDLTGDIPGRILWEFRPELPDVQETRRVACCGDQTRGLYYADGRIFLQTLDGQVIALDAATGEVVWQMQGANLAAAETLTGAGGVFGGLFVTGSAGGEFGVRGSVSAYDIETGALAYRMYSMGPDADVGITADYHAFYPDNQTSVATWYGNSWERGGGTAWGYFTYDPDRDTFFYATGNCGPWNPDYRRDWGVIELDENGGLIDYRNNWCASQLAREASSGNLVWAYNITPADAWDLDGPSATILTELELGGTPSDVAMKLASNGWFYVWDRDSGQIVNNPWMAVYSDIVRGVDVDTGRARYDIAQWTFTDLADRRRYTDADPIRAGLAPNANLPARYTGTEIVYCPGAAARDWQNDAYSPRTGLLYTVVNTTCTAQRAVTGDYTPGQGYILTEGAGTAPRRWFGGEIVSFQSQIQANNPLANAAGTYAWPDAPGADATRWAITFDEATEGPIMATASDLLFTGDSSTGRFVAIDATSGEIVWRFRIGQTFHGSPVTYIGPDGRQYVAVIGSGEDTLDVNYNAGANAAARFARGGANIYVFALPPSVVGR